MSTPYEPPEEENVNEEEETQENGSESTEEEENVVEKTQRYAQTAQHMMQAAQHGVQALISIVTNPVTWLLIAIFVVAMGVYSTIQVLGRNENACFGSNAVSQDEGAGGTGSGNTPADMQKVADIVGTWLMKNKFPFLGNKAMSKEEAAAVIGNAYQESSLNPKSTNQIGAQGLWQWIPKYSKLGQTASEMGKPWQDIGVQLTYLARTLNTTEKDAFKIYGQPQARAFLNTDNHDVASLTNAWAWGYERMGKGEANVGNRIKGAEDFMKYFKPVPDSELPKTGDTWNSKYGGDGGSGGGGDAAAQAADAAVPAACGDDDFDNSSIVKLAESLAWPLGDKAEAADKHDGTHGKSSATPAYVKAKKRAEELGGADPQDLFSDCGRFVATVVKNTVDKKFPWGPTSAQYDYMKKHTELWKEVGEHKADARPGDIFVKGGEGGSGHIGIYIGHYKGIDATADASMDDRTGLIGYFDIYNANMFGNGARQFTLFRYIGPNASSLDGEVENPDSSSSK